MATNIYLEENGESQVMTEIEGIALMGIAGDPDSQQLAKYITQGLDLLETVGIPQNKALMMFGTEEDGSTRTFNLLKPIISSRPLMEFRVNRTVPGAFRAIFFEYYLEGEQLLVFTRALLKQGDKNPPQLRIAIKDSEKLYDSFCKDPYKYLAKDV